MAGRILLAAVIIVLSGFNIAYPQEETSVLDSLGNPVMDTVYTREYRIDTSIYEQDGYKFITIYNDSIYVSSLEIIKNGVVILKEEELERIVAIAGYDLRGTGNKDILIESYSGGAHCCITLFIGQVKDNRFTVTDTVFWGDSGYEVKDINSDGKLEMIGVFTGFAYAYTSYAASAFPIVIYAYDKGKLINATGKFKAAVMKDISGFKKDVKEFPEYDCPKNKDDMWGSEAGTLKGILAAIAYDYASIGQAEKGYDYIDDHYDCFDKKEFLKELKKMFK